MKNDPSAFFGKDHATAYDDRWASSAPMLNALHFLMQKVLSDLPKDAHILSVGAGTGAEIIALAKENPGWRFTAVEPSLPMLDVLRAKIKSLGFEDRCKTHGGFLDSYTSNDRYDGATSILVSQFLTDKQDRISFFREIASRLKPGGTLISADLSSSLNESDYRTLIEVWMRTHSSASKQTFQSITASWGTLVAVSPQEEIKSILTSAGFLDPILFYQALFIHAWFAKTKS